VGTDSSHKRRELACPECGVHFSFAVPSDSEVPIPCPECGAATPVTDEDPADVDDDSVSSTDTDDENFSEGASTAHGLPGQKQGEGDATSRRRPADSDAVDATTAHGLPTQSGETEATPEEEHGDGESEGHETSPKEATSSAAESDESGSADERTPEDPKRMHGTPDLDPGGNSNETFQGVGPAGGQPAVEGDGGETTRADVVDRVAGKAAGSNARDDAKPEEASDDGARDATPESGTDAGTNEQRDSDASQPDLQNRWSTPPPQDAVDADEEQQGIVTQEVDSVPEILADSDADDLQEAEPPEPAYETKPDGRTLVRDESETDDRLEPNDASEDPHGREESGLPEAPSSREQTEPDSDETVSEEAEARDQVEDDADGELAPDEPEPVRASDDVDYRVDPSTNLEVAADEAMARAMEAAQQEPAPRSPDREREILELREQIPDEAFRVRIENYVYTEVSRERLAKVIAEGRVFSLDAVATEDGEWMHPTEHPALESLRRRRPMKHIACSTPRPNRNPGRSTSTNSRARTETRSDPLPCLTSPNPERRARWASVPQWTEKRKSISRMMRPWRSRHRHRPSRVPLPKIPNSRGERIHRRAIAAMRRSSR
jgi:hypothetical protein